MREVVKTVIQFLLFRPVKPDLETQGSTYLVFGILAAWMAGIGRYWDNPRAAWWQHVGLGSVLYLFIVALVLWLIVKPLRPQHWTLTNVCIFLGMTAPLGLAYAVPVERYLPLATAQRINAWILAVVAAWRVALWIAYLKNSAQFRGWILVTAAFLPLVIVVTALSALNLERAVFEIMGGFRPPTSADAAYGVLLLITLASIAATPILLVSYAILISRNRRNIA